MQNQYSKNTYQFNYWNRFNSRELNSKENLFFHDNKWIKYTLLTAVFCLVISAVVIII